jgi:hypothetical protein
MDRIDDGSALNISTGKLTSFIDLAELILSRVGKAATVLPQSDMPEGVFARGGHTAHGRAGGRDRPRRRVPPSPAACGMTSEHRDLAGPGRHRRRART